MCATDQPAMVVVCGPEGAHGVSVIHKTEFSGANVDRKIFIFPVQLTTSRIGNLTRATLPS